MAGLDGQANTLSIAYKHIRTCHAGTIIFLTNMNLKLVSFPPFFSFSSVDVCGVWGYEIVAAAVAVALKYVGVHLLW